MIPVQKEIFGKGAKAQLVMIMPEGEAGIRKFKLLESDSILNVAMKAIQNPKSGQVVILEDY